MKLSRINPFGDQTAADQLDSWAAALELAVATLTGTLEEIKDLKQKGGADAPGTPRVDDGSGEPDSG